MFTKAPKSWVVGNPDRIHFTGYRTSRRLASSLLTRLAGGDSAVAVWPLPACGRFRVDLLLPPRQHVLRRDIADGAVQADAVVVIHVALDQTPRIVERQRRSGPDALTL